MNIVNRRQFVGTLGVLAGTAALPLRAHVGETKRPNILFIMADDLGYADLSCYGRTDYLTPSIDGLARQGVRYLQAYANSSVCSPTRLSLMTGRYQYRLRAGLEEPIHPAYDFGLDPSLPTLPSLLKDADYHTALIGKWHLGSLPNFGPLKSGYDEFWGFRQGGVDYYTHKVGADGDLWDGKTSIEETGYLTELLGDRAVEFVGSPQSREKPFFLSLHFSAPHWPWEPPDSQSESDYLSKNTHPIALLHHDGGTLETYGKMVQSMDQQVGRVLRALDENGLSDNTIVIFTSDNGGERFSNTWPFSGRKGELLEGGVRVPLVVRWPGQLPSDIENTDIATTMDWHPTLLAAAGAKAPNDFPPDGLDLFENFDTQTLRQRTLFWRHKEHGQEACRRGDWKYLKIGENSFLFNVILDPLERANLKARRPEIFEELKAAFEDWNSQMLVSPDDAYSYKLDGAKFADRYGN